MAKPLPYSPELAEVFLDRVAEGRTPLSVSKDEDMPSRSTITRWARNNPDFARRLGVARIELAHTMAEESVVIADTDTDPQRARNRVEVRKWFCGTVLPKTYGPRAQLDVTIDDRTDFGAKIEQAQARIAKRRREQGRIVDGESVRLPEAVPAGVPMVDAAGVPMMAPAGASDVDPFS